MIYIDVNKKLHGSCGDMELDVNLEIKEGEFLAILGKSGSGKTTLLRILAGLESSKGHIKIGDELWQDNNFSLIPQKREIGFVFQDYALFPNMSVEENLLFVKKDYSLASHLLSITELLELKNRAPNSLSGGQKQRVSLCRALMRRPKLLLLDEPLSALDPSMRGKLQDEILSLHREFKTTTILVSHDSSEIYKLASRAVVLEEGKIINNGTPKEVLLTTSKDGKSYLIGEILEIKKADIDYVATILIERQLVEISLSKKEVQNLNIGDKIRVITIPHQI